MELFRQSFRPKNEEIALRLANDEFDFKFVDGFFSDALNPFLVSRIFGFETDDSAVRSDHAKNSEEAKRFLVSFAVVIRSEANEIGSEKLNIRTFFKRFDQFK